MNFFNKIRRKLKHGSASLGIVAAVIAAVLLLNIGATMLFSGNFIFLDMSPESKYNVYSSNNMQIKKTTTMYSLMDETVFQLDGIFERLSKERGEDDPVKIDIIFCNDPDQLIANDMMRHIYYTALLLEKEYPKNIDVQTTNVWTNPSSVDAYRTNSYSQIYQSNIIISSGTEYRIATPKTYYVYSESGSSSPWAYHGEKKFVAQILAVTKAESPICCLTTNHGEPVKNDEYSEFRKVLESVGYEVRYIDLQKEEIPKNCRLIITLDPQSDFYADYLNPNATTEITKLQAHLDQSYSYMIFADANTPKLPVLEEYLEEWGISFVRPNGDHTYELSDPEFSLDAKTQGTNLIGQYEVVAPSSRWTEDMRNYGAYPKVIFGDAIGIRYSDLYQLTYQPEDKEQGISPYTYGSFSSNGYSRMIFDLFRTGNKASAFESKDGNRLTDAEGNPIVFSDAPFRLMTISNENTYHSEGSGYTSATESAYVCAVGSVRFVSNEMLQSDTYGNVDALLSVLRSLGEEVEPVGLNFKMMHNELIHEEIIANTNVIAWTVVLIALPLVACSLAGVFVLVRRKANH